MNLPDDILTLISDELLAQRDFSTLYNIVVASKSLALCSLPHLYRIYNESPDDDDEAEGQNAAQQELLVQKWAIKWRSIILSCMNKTVFPYYQWLKTLDLRDLSYLFSDQKFRNKIERLFFDGPLTALKRQKKWQPNKKFPPRTILDGDAVVEAAADVLVPKIRGVEKLSGPFQPEAFLRWVPHLHRLQRLELWIGTALRGDDVQQAIYSHCPEFSALSIYTWQDPNSTSQFPLDSNEADVELGRFIAGLPQQSLTYFENIRQCGIGHTTCQALAKHNKSLKELRLCLEKEAISSLLLLQSCTNLTKLKLDVAGVAVDENSTKEDTLTELTDWLKECTHLQSIEFEEVGFAPKLLAPLLRRKDILLEDLDVKASRNWYSMRDSRDFHQSLATQNRLRNLSLFGDAADVTSDDNDALIDSVCQCHELRRLKLRGVSEYVSEEAVIRILAVLRKLDEVYIQGLNLGDNVLESVATHPRLQSVCFMDLTSFTFPGLLAFVERLDDSKQNFELYINMASTEHLLSDEEIQMIRQLLYDKVGGKFDYVPFRDPGASDFSGDSD